MSEHNAHRPTWNCRACEKPWPCKPAREALVIEMNRIELAAYMWVSLEEAAGDLPSMPATDAFERFIYWTR